MRQSARGRRFLRAAAASLISAAAAGCAAGVPAASVQSSRVTGRGPITFATGRVDTSYLTGLVAQWNTAHPRQRVTVIDLPDEADEQHAQMVSNLQARSDVYDVMSLDVDWTAEFASNGWIEPLSPSAAPLGKFLAPAVATARYEGRLWAIPFTSNAGLLYYRTDLVARPPATWAQLAADARTIGPRHHIAGYGSQFADYEGLTVNFAEAVSSAGGSLLARSGTRATVDTPQARDALSFLVSGFRQGWIPPAALSWDETASANAFVAGRLLFLRNWPYVYGEASNPRHSKVAGKFGVAVLPGQDGPGVSVLGGANLAISAFSQHPATALAFVRFLTSLPSERRILVDAALPPVWSRLYGDPALIRRFPYLPVLRRAIMSAVLRPQTPIYDQLSLAISSSVHQALAAQVPVSKTLTSLNSELTRLVRTR